MNNRWIFNQIIIVNTTKFIKHISCLNTKNILDLELIVLSQKLLNTAFKNYFFEQNNLLN